MVYKCPMCDGAFSSSSALLKHTESTSCFGPNPSQAVHNGVSAWEASRDQRNTFTGSSSNFLGNVTITDDAYDSDTNTWNCCMCNKEFNSWKGLNQHINSGTHDSKDNYVCQQCNRGFSRMSSLADHTLQKHGQSTTTRLTNVLTHDLSNMGTRMLTDGSEGRHEALLRFDGGCRPNPGCGGCGFVLQDTIQGWIIAKESFPVYAYPTTSNVAEYEGLIEGLRSAVSHGVRRLKVEGDSNLVIQQMLGNWACNNYNLSSSRDKANGYVAKLQTVTFHHIDRSNNWEADELAREGVNDARDMHGY